MESADIVWGGGNITNLDRLKIVQNDADRVCFWCHGALQHYVANG